MYRRVAFLALVIMLAASCAPATPTAEIVKPAFPIGQTDAELLRTWMEQRKFCVEPIVPELPDEAENGIDCYALPSAKSIQEDSNSPVVILVVDDFGYIPVWQFAKPLEGLDTLPIEIKKEPPKETDNCLMDPNGQGMYVSLGSAVGSAIGQGLYVSLGSAESNQKGDIGIPPHGEVVFEELKSELENLHANLVASVDNDQCWKRKMALYQFNDGQNILLVGIDTENYDTLTVAKNIEAAIDELSNPKFYVDDHELTGTNRFVINMSFAVVPCSSYDFNGDEVDLVEREKIYQAYYLDSNDPAFNHLFINIHDLRLVAQTVEPEPTFTPAEQGQTQSTAEMWPLVDSTQNVRDLLGSFSLFQEFYPLLNTQAEVDEYINGVMNEIIDEDVLASLLACYAKNKERTIIPVASAGNFSSYIYPFLPALLDEVVSVSASYTNIQELCPPITNKVGSNPGEVTMDGTLQQGDYCSAGTSFAAPRLSLQIARMILDGTLCPTESEVLPPLGYANLYGPWRNLSLDEVLTNYCPNSPTPEEAEPPSAAASQVRPGNSIQAIFLGSPPIIDANLDEWYLQPYPVNNIVYGSDEWQGENDLIANVMIGWDDQNLYLGARIQDDFYQQISTGEHLYQGDSLELQFDTDLLTDFDSQELSLDDFQLGISPGTEYPGSFPEAYLWNPYELRGSRDNINTSAAPTDYGYILEAALPWSTFETSPQVGQHYGFAFNVSDNDWFSQESQQSMISTTPNRTLTDPTTWGDLVLNLESLSQSTFLDWPLALGDDMQPNEVLLPGHSIRSENGLYTFVYQTDGNLVLYRNSDLVPLWVSNTYGMPIGALIMQEDGNLVIYDPVSYPLWSSETCCEAGNWLLVQNDGNVVIYRPDNTQIWATNTGQQ